MPRAGVLRGTSDLLQERLQPRALAQWRHPHRTAAACAAERTLDSPATARFTSMHDSRHLPRSNPPRWSVCLLALRSEEHTSELQSLMRNSYAVFCLKKTHKTNTQTYTQW